MTVRPTFATAVTRRAGTIREAGVTEVKGLSDTSNIGFGGFRSVYTCAARHRSAR
jgi:hypothetical protein